MDLLFLIFNAAIFFQYAKLLSLWGITRSTERFIFAYFLLMVQIIATLLLLGALGLLRPIPALVINILVISTLTFIFRPLYLINPVIKARMMWKIILKPFSNKLIAAGALFVLGWLFVCAYYLPPRGVDDLTYHLPFIYESIQRGSWALLPTDLRVQFAYPMNVEVLYTWPVLILRDTRWVDASQIPIGVWTAGIIYLITRHFGLRRTKAFFLAGVFLLTPIVIAQMGTNYIDVSSAGFLLMSLYLTLRFFKTFRKVYLRLSFLSIGTMIGIKYHILYVGLVLTLVLLIELLRRRWISDFLWGIFALAGLGLGWHLRNFLLFTDWEYPIRHVAGTDLSMVYHSAGQSVLSILNKIEITFINFINVGTVDRGFGAFYSIIIFLSWILGGWIFLFRKHSWRKGEVLLFIVALYFLLLMIPIKNAPFPYLGPRTLLAVWPIFILIFGRICFVLNKKKWIHQLIIVICFLGFLMDAKPVVSSTMPNHHWWGRSKVSEFDAYRFSTWYIKRLASSASILDVMTQSLHRQATVFLAAPWGEFFSAPYYGRFLQAKIINFDDHFKGEPDFLVYLTVSPEPLVYVGKYHKTFQEAMHSEYKQVFSCLYGHIFVHPRVFQNGHLHISFSNKAGL